jgi:superfamily I DNA/RNA helicase
MPGRMFRPLSPDGPLAEMTLAELGLMAKARDRVLVATIHSAKGLEFDTVVVVGCDEGNIPTWRPNETLTSEPHTAELWVRAGVPGSV